jgi:hypothetical protein
MTEDKKIIEENWASDAWEARVKGQPDGCSDGDMPSDEQLTAEVLDAGQKARQADADRLSDEDLQRHDVPLPPPTLVSLASGLAAQTMVSLGVFPNPATGKRVMLLNQAAHLIDTIELLCEKTSGNRTEEETRTLENMLHELRMIYLAAQKEKSKR